MPRQWGSPPSPGYTKWLQ